MTKDIHVSRSKILILNGSRSTDVNTKYQQQQTNNLSSLAFFKKSINHFEKTQCTKVLFKTGVKVIYFFNSIQLLSAAFAPTVAR